MNTRSRSQPALLLVDDDEIFCRVLQKALIKRGFAVDIAHDPARAIEIASPGHSHAVVDLNLPGNSGLSLIPQLINIRKDMAIVVLTGYASIQTAVEAIKLGARHYLTKPADADEILEALGKRDGTSNVEIVARPIPYNRLEWEHLQKVLGECEGNVSEAARRLGMHRRTLQRKLQKRPSQTGN
ncbi:MAG: response regulator transcription factor [Gammaproteobacteria bacterium]|nr:response regulator transcription factor [Gammaproteobacteria bacterium]